MRTLTTGQQVTVAIFTPGPNGEGRRLRETFGAKVTEVGTSHFRAEPISVDVPRFDRDWFPIEGAPLVTVIPHAETR